MAPARPAGPGVPGEERLASRGGWEAGERSGSRALRAPARPHLDVEVRRVEAARAVMSQALAAHRSCGTSSRARCTRNSQSPWADADAARAHAGPQGGGRHGPGRRRRGRYYAGAERAERFRVCGRPPRACLRLWGPRPGSSPGASGSPRRRSSGSLSAGSRRDPVSPGSLRARPPGRPQDAGGGSGPRTVPGAPRPGVTGGVDARKVCARVLSPRSASDRAAVRTFHVSLPPRVFVP